MVREKFIKHNHDGENPEIMRMNTGGEKLINDEIDNLRTQFKAIDLNKSGLITMEELANAIQSLNIKLDEEEVKHMVQEMDYVGNGKINYSEFLAATLSAKNTLTDETLWRLFKTFDVDDTDYISRANLREAFQRLGRDYQVGEEEVAEMI